LFVRTIKPLSDQSQIFSTTLEMHVYVRGVLEISR